MADEEKTEKATPKKRQDERKKGNAFSSKDFTTVLELALVFSVVKLWFPTIYKEVAGTFHLYLERMQEVQTVTVETGREIMFDVMIIFVITIGPILTASILAAVVGTGVQTRFLFSRESLNPKFSRLNPLSGIKRIISIRSLIEVLKGIIKMIAVGYVMFSFFKGRFHTLMQTMFIGLQGSVAYTLDAIMDMTYMVCLIFIFIAGFDFLYQRWEYEKQIKMTKKEIKEEYKQMEGDPKVKGKIKEMQRKAAMSRMMQAVPDADVIIRNPTHFAVALKYDIEHDQAPSVIAKGQDEMALRIVKIAEEHNVYITENKELARAIYAIAPLNGEIPMEYYGAVAEVLAVVYRLREKKKRL